MQMLFNRNVQTKINIVLHLKIEKNVLHVKEENIFNKTRKTIYI